MNLDEAETIIARTVAGGGVMSDPGETVRVGAPPAEKPSSMPTDRGASASWGDYGRPDAFNFSIVSQLGQGGMGEVHLAMHRAFGREVALKMVRGDHAAMGRLEHQFLAEAIATGHLDHPNIVPVHALGMNDAGQRFMAMKLVTGRTWREILEESDDLLAPEVLEANIATLQATAHAVAYAHSKGILHRDLKPSNVMVGGFGEVLVMDWGMAVRLDDEQDGPLSVLRPASSVNLIEGTPSYLAPEMARGRGDRLGPWTDVYLLGALLHEILTGKPPHRGKTMSEVVQHASMSPPPAYADDVPAPVAAVARRAMARETEDRYATVAGFQAALRGAMSSRESLALQARAESSLDAAEAEPDTSSRRADELYGEAIAGFREAGHLWSENAAAAADGVRRARLAYARRAFRRGDYELASAQIEGLDDDEARNLRSEVETAGARRREAERTTARQRRLLRVAGIAIVVGLVIGIIAVETQRRRANRNAEEARLETQRANEARTRTERLAELMLRDIHDGLASIGRLDLLESVVESVRDHYETVELGDDATATDVVNRVRLFMNMAEILEASGQPDAAAASLDRAIAIGRASDDDHGADAELRSTLVEVLTRAAVAAVAADRDADATAALEEARRRLDASALAETVTLARSGYIEDTWRMLHERRLRHDEALAAGERALAARRKRFDLEKTSAAGRDLAKSMLIVASSLGRLGQVDRRRALATELAAFLDEQLAAHPDDDDWQAEAALAFQLAAPVLAEAGRIDTSRRLVQRALEIRERRAAVDPTNVTRRYELASARVSAVQNPPGWSPDVTLSVARKAVEALKELLKLAPDNDDWRIEAAIATKELSTVLLAQQRIPEGRDYAAQAHALLEKPANPANANRFAQGRISTHDAIVQGDLAAGDFETAAESIRALIDSLDAFPAPSHAVRQQQAAAWVRLAQCLATLALAGADYAPALEAFDEALRRLDALREITGPKSHMAILHAGVTDLYETHVVAAARRDLDRLEEETGSLASALEKLLERDDLHPKARDAMTALVRARTSGDTRTIAEVFAALVDAEPNGARARSAAERFAEQLKIYGLAHHLLDVAALTALRTGRPNDALAHVETLIAPLPDGTPQKLTLRQRVVVALVLASHRPGEAGKRIDRLLAEDALSDDLETLLEEAEDILDR